MTIRHASTARRGFSFIEILFAVMVLGVGFIMIAAIFPVAIRQAQGTVEETATARVLVNARTQLGSRIVFDDINDFTGLAGAPGVYLAARDPRRPPTPPGTDFWELAKGSFIDSSDPRFAWTFLYRRDRLATGTQLPPTILYVATTVRNRPTYDAQDLFRFQNPTTVDDTDESLPWATLQPKLVRVILIDNGTTDTVEVLPAQSAPVPMVVGGTVPNGDIPDFTGAVGEGSLIVVSDDNVAAPYTTAPFTPTIPYVPGTANGRVYRVAGRSSNAPVNTGAIVWDLAPGSDMADVRENLPLAATDRNAPAKLPIGIIFGRSYGEVTNPASGFQGRVQDLAVQSGGL
jgi:hypothetical protein